MYDNRSRKFSWVDPHPALDVVRKVSGLEYIRMVMRGEVPPAPVCELVGFRIVLAEPSEIGIEFEPAEYHYNVVGSVHGGITCTLLDSAMSIAVHTALPADHGFATLQLNTHFVRPITVRTGLTRCEGKVTHSGARIATAEGRLVDANGKLYAHGTATCMTFPLGAT
jgi:uncharacterized protein (TIGR00369 family)